MRWYGLSGPNGPNAQNGRTAGARNRMPAGPESTAGQESKGLSGEKFRNEKCIDGKRRSEERSWKRYSGEECIGEKCRSEERSGERYCGEECRLFREKQ